MLYIDMIPTDSQTEAHILNWKDETIQIDHLCTNEDGSYTNYPNTTTAYGLYRNYTDIKEFWSVDGGVNYTRVVNNKVEKPAPKSLILTTTQILSAGGTKLVTTKEVEGFSLTISSPGLYKIDRKTGYVEARVSIGVYYRVYNPEAPNAEWNIVHTNYIISGKQRAEIVKTIKHSDVDARLPLAKYEILVVRNTEDHTGNLDYSDDLFVKELTEIVYSNIAYNHTALLGVKIRATDQLSGQLPTITSLVKGIKIRVPSNLVEAYKVRYIDGNYNKTVIDQAYAAGWVDGELSSELVWTDNPIWCLYDLLTNKRYGLADYYKISESKRGLMLANFYLLAKYCDEGITYIDSNSAQSEVKIRPRFALNMVIDQSKTASEWIQQILAICRAVGFYNEGAYWLDIDRKKPISQLFNMSSIREFSQTCTSYKAIPNCFEVQWINPLTNYEIDSFRLESSELQTNPTIEEHKKALQLIGVTNLDQAKAAAKYALLSGEYKTKFVTFKTGTQGLRCSVTDVIGIQHDVPQWGYGGKIKSYNEATRTLILSNPVVFDGTSTYSIKVSHVVDNIQEYSILSPIGTYSEIVLKEDPEYSFVGGEDFILSTTTNGIAQFKISAIRRSEDGLCEITAVEYNEEMYDACDDTSDLGIIVTKDYSLLTNPSRTSVQGVNASVKYYQDSLGVWKTGVEIFYDPVNNSFWRGAQLHYSIIDSSVYTSVDTNNSGYFFVPTIEDGKYRFVVTSIFTNGKQTISDALSDYDRHPWTTLTVNNLAPIEEFLAGVSGLSILNKGNDGSFLGRDCVVTWRKPAIIDAIADIDAGMEAAGAATSSADNWFGYYKVVVSTTTGDIRRIEKVYNTEKYTYTHEYNIADGITRTFLITVYAVDRLGRESEGRTIECKNPAPSAIN